MRTMGAVAGVPGPELEKLSALAKKAGADTVFSANEAATAMLNLGKAGISTSDIMGGALTATLSLATAGDLDLGTAATVAANAMHTFGLQGKDAGAVADALAGAANASSADVSDLALALSQGGLAAHAAGLSIQETTAVLAAFADAGLKGSDAGTSLKTFLLNLVPSSKSAIEAMNELGLKFTDAAGAMLPINDIAEQLKNKTANLSDAQKTLALQTIFGTDAYRAALVISQQGAAGLAQYEAATNKVGTAGEVADAKMQGWKGTWEQFKGSLETAALSIGEVVIPAITPLVDKVKELADGFTALDPKQAETAVKLGAIAAAAGPALYLIGKIASVAGSAASGISTFGLSMAKAAEGGGALSGVTGTIGTALAGVTGGEVILAVAAIAALGVAFVEAYKHSEKFRDIVTAAWDKITSYVHGLWEGQLKPVFEDFMRIVSALKPVLIGIAAVVAISLVAPIVGAALALKVALEGIHQVLQVTAAVVETVGRNIGPVWGDVEVAAGGLWHAVQAAWDGISTAINDAWQKVNPIWQAMQSAWDGVTAAANALWRGMQVAWDGITGVVVGAWHLLQPVWQAMQDAWDAITAAANALWQAMQVAWDGITKVVNVAWQVVSAVFMEWVRIHEAVLRPAVLLLVAVVQDSWDLIQGAIGAAWAIIKAIWAGIDGVIHDTLIPAFNLLRDVVQAVWDAIGAAVSFAWNSVILPVWNAVVGFLDGVFTATWQAFQASAEAVWDAITAAVTFAWDNAIHPAWDAIVGFLDGVFTTTWNAFRDTASAVWDGIKTAVSDAWGFIQGVWNDIVNTLDGPLTTAMNTFKTVASDVWDTFKGAATSAWDGVKTVIGTSLRTIGNLVSGFLGVVGRIARVVGLNHIADVLQEGADAAGQWGEGMARGGAMGSPGRVGAGFVTNGPRAIVGEGNPMYPEYVIPTDPKFKSRATGLLVEASDRLFPQHAAGTNSIGTSGSPIKKPMVGDAPGWLQNVASFGADVVEGIGGALADVASWTVDQVRKLGKAGLEKAWPKLNVPDHLGGIPPGGINSVRQGVLDAIWSSVPAEPAGGDGGPGVPYDGSGRIGSGWQQITGYLDSVGQPYTITSTTGGEHVAGSLHYQGKAVDMVGDMGAIFRTLAAGNPVPGINELFYDPMGYFYDEGQRQSGAIGGHSDHVHAATFDRGGVLRPGPNRLNNNTGAPEALVPAMAFGGALPGPNPWENPFFNPGAWAARNVDEWATGTPAPDTPTPADLSNAPMFSAPSGGGAAPLTLAIADGAFSPVFHGSVTPEVMAAFDAKLQDAIRQIVMALRMGVR